MSQRDRILKMLEAAGERGISSKVLYREFIGRGGARIKELREMGYAIDSSERDPSDPKYVIYKLQGQRGATRRSTNERTGYEDNPTTAGIARRPGRTETEGDKSEVPPAAPEDVGFDADTERASVAREAAERAPGLCSDSEKVGKRARQQKVGVESSEVVGVPAMFDFDADWAA